MKRMLLPMLLLASCFAQAQVPKEFNACAIFTADDAAKALGAPAEQEVPKGKPPKVMPKLIPSCTYTATVEGKEQAATVLFRFARTPGEASADFKQSRLDMRGKPVIISGSDAYWHTKLAQLQVVKGATWLVISAGPLKETERQPDQARKLAELLLPKL